jgi:hypothetical protein
VTGCAISPDGAYVVSVGADNTVRLWHAASGQEVAAVLLIGLPTSVAVHPWLPFIACGDMSGGLYLIDLVDLEYGPIVVAAVRSDGELAVRCPGCWHNHRIEPGVLGSEIGCPTATCRLRLRVIPTALSPRPPRTR